MLDLLVKSAVRRKIIGLFAINPGLQFYPRQVANELGESPHAVGLELKYLQKGGLLKRSEEAKHTLYQWNANYPFAKSLESIVEKMRDLGNEEMRSLSDLTRRKQIKENLERVLKDIKRFYDPEKVILFGSATSGKVGPYSDVDLVVIKKTSLPFFKRVQQLVDLLDYDIGFDFLVYTPEEFKEAAKQKIFFKEEIVKKGKVLYEKAA